MEKGPQLNVASNKLVKPEIEPATPGLQGEMFIHYTTAAPQGGVVDKPLTLYTRVCGFNPCFSSLLGKTLDRIWSRYDLSCWWDVKNTNKHLLIWSSHSTSNAFHATLYVLMDSTFLFDRTNLGWSIVYVKG